MEGLIPVNSEPNYSTAKMTEASLFFASEAATNKGSLVACNLAVNQTRVYSKHDLFHAITSDRFHKFTA